MLEIGFVDKKRLLHTFYKKKCLHMNFFSFFSAVLKKFPQNIQQQNLFLTFIRTIINNY